MKIKKANQILIFMIVISPFFPIELNAQQINVGTIEMMPNAPSPYQMRNWKKVAAGYDSLVFNSSLSGLYLPLIFNRDNTVNYSGQRSFGIHSYVGTNNPQQGEAINVLPAVIGASLIGIDKSNQNLRNYVLESREYFNKRPEENIYLNEPVGSSGDDWWYETMPNVFFYQLYSLYPGTIEFNNQFTTVADRWLQAVYAMGGATTPWNIPTMNYRAWNFSTMTPNTTGVHEPEASGTIAWILYNAFKVTGDQKYRIGAELSLEYLNSLGSNPAYEIQLPYGTYLAARMNAELGTSYDIEKMINWCFEQSPLRSWGATTGKWGFWDVNGLIGELQPRNYAFAMNTFEQIGALVPLVRYDQRFARAIGKWVLNAANSARLFYSNYLSDADQDSRSWAKQYDPNSSIAYEALLKTPNDLIKGTGDAVSGGWAATNLGLYGSSHVGILGAIIDTTNIPMILKLDLLKTDYFHKSAYPSFLIYNPYNMDNDVFVDVGSNSSDIYDEVSHFVIARNVQGTTSVTIPADQAIIAVIIPAGSILNFELDKTLVNGTVIDYKNSLSVQNYPPRIKSLSSAKINITVNDSINIYCTAMDRVGQQLSYQWKANGGNIAGSGFTIKWNPPNSPGIYALSVVVDNSYGAKDSAQINITVSNFINYPPVINKIKATLRKIDVGSTSLISCTASDPNGDSLNYSWSASFGNLSGAGKNVSWKAPAIEGNYFIKCTVTDTHNSSDTDSLGVEVRDFSKNQTGNLIAFYPFNNNTNDESVNGNNGTITGAVFTNDRFNNLLRALHFDGVDDEIQIKNSSPLNFQNAISISFWMKLDQLPTKEPYIISHGSYDKRYKVSMPNRKLRWTIKTDKAGGGILDLDSESLLDANKLYNCVVTYSGTDAEIWINGELNSFVTWSGKLLMSDVDLTIAQMLPTDANYNFKGVLDDFRIYDYALPVDEIQKLYDLPVGIKNDNEVPTRFMLYQNYPNPFNPSTVINYELATGGLVILKVYDILGREVVTLVNEYQNAGIHNSQFSIRDLPAGRQGSQLSSGVYFYQLRVGGRFVQSKKMLLIK